MRSVSLRLCWWDHPAADTSPSKWRSAAPTESPASSCSDPRATFKGDLLSLTRSINYPIQWTPAWVKESMTWFPRFHQVPQWYIKERVQDGVRIPAHVWRDTFNGLITARPPTEAGTIAALTLIIWGDRDELLTREQEEALAAAIPASRLVIYEDTGHMVLWEQPERVASDLIAFIENLPAGTSDGP